MPHDNAPPVRRQAVGQVVTHLVLIGLGLWLWSTHGAWWWLGTGMVGLFTLTMMKPLYHMAVSHSYMRQQRQWEYESMVEIRGKTAALATPQDQVFAKLTTRAGAVLGVKHGQVLTYDFYQPGQGHGVCIGPARTGKTSSVVIPTVINQGIVVKALQDSISGYINDPKGEIWQTTAPFLNWAGVRPLALNPFDIPGIPNHKLNPLQPLADDYLMNDGREALALSDIISQCLMPTPRGGGGDNLVFLQGARRLGQILQNYMAVFLPDECNLITLHELAMADIDRLKLIVDQMRRCTDYRGAIRSLGNQLHNLLDPNFRKTFTAYRQDLEEGMKIYAPSSAWADNLKGSDFTFPDLLERPTFLYGIMHGSKLTTHGGFNSLATTLLIETLARHPGYAKFFMIMDEVGNLPLIPEDTFRNALALLPSKGLRMFSFWQTQGQIDRYSPELARMIIDQASMLQAWGIRDLKMQEEWSKRCGKTTRKDATFRKNALEMDYALEKTFSERDEQVLSETEISRMSDDDQLIWIAGGHPVIYAKRCSYWRIHPFRSFAAPNRCEGGGYPPGEDIEYSI